MSTAVVPLPERRTLAGQGLGLAAALLGVAVLAAVLAGAVPIQFSIATVFLFAGPHNWFEARYFLGRLPARAGKLWGFFALSAAGIVGLTVAFAAMPSYLNAVDGDAETWTTTVALWNTSLVVWIVTLIVMRSRQNPRRDWGWAVPAGFFLLALNWLDPFAWSVGLVYTHPLMALWILDRELKRSRPAWRPAYHAVLASLPVLLLALWWRLGDAPPLPGDDVLTAAITRHAGSEILEGFSSHFLVAAHTFLEMVHYSVWLLALPLIGMRSAPWRLDTIPAARRSAGWRRGVAALLLFGALVALVLWVCFLVDYPTTRQVYFTVALLHVLAEVPFLLRVQL
jgi:hypothetical protein